MTRPLISVAMPTYDPEERHLREAIESVRGQRHPDWELRIADDGSTRRGVRRMLEHYGSSDPRVEVEFWSRNSGISAASNRAVARCGGEYIAFLDHDDAIAADALLEVARAVEADPSIDVIYSDQDKLDRRGRRVAPFFKPDWSPVYALGAMYVGHLLVVRRSLLGDVGGFDSRFDTIQDFELLLRLSERTDRIHHLARVLYHWRAIPGSIAAGADEKSGVPALQARAVSEHLRRRGVGAHAIPHPRIPHRTRLVPDRPDDLPSVSAIVVQRGERRNLERCLDSLRRAAHPDLEVVVAQREVTRGVSVACNRAATQASGEWLLFCGADTELAEPDTVDTLLTYASIPGVGIVGPQSVHPDGRVRHAGLTLRRLGPSGARAVGGWWHGRSPAEPVLRGAAGDGDGYYGSLSCSREVAGVPCSCMMVSRALFDRVGGFDEGYRTQFHDVDLCLRVRRLGLRVVCASHPRVVAHDLAPSGLRDDVIDRALFIDTWFDELDRGDPYLNLHLSAAMEPAAGLPRRGAAGLRFASRP